MSPDGNEKRIKDLELVTKRLARRAVKKSVVMIPPSVASGYMFGTDVRGPILGFMFPCEGTITKAMIRLNDKPKGSPTVDVQAYIGDTIQSISVPLTKRVNAVDIDYKVTAGDCVSISINPSDEQLLSEVWASLLWKPTVKDMEAKNFLINELDGE